MKEFFICRIQLIITILLIGCLSQMQAQITIGDKSAPTTGALLQLKESNNVGANSTRGLMLPRVALTSSAELYPMFEKDYVGYELEEVKNLKAEHTGLMVFANNSFGNNQCPGVYSWNGAQWENQMPKVDEEHKTTMPDGEGNTYKYKQYGNLYWYTENLRSITTNADGTTPIPTSDIPNHGKKVYVNLGIKNNVAGSQLLVANLDELDTYKNTVAGYDLPIGWHAYIVNGELVKLPLREFVNTFGFLYTNTQAQVACPSADGWRLPTDTEWQSLLTEMKKIATQAGKTGEGYAMKNDDSKYIRIDQPNVENQWGGLDPCLPVARENNPYFNALPAGWGSNGNQSYTQQFGEAAAWWAKNGGTTANPIRYRYRFLSGASIINRTDDVALGNRYSIRCVKEAN